MFTLKRRPAAKTYQYAAGGASIDAGVRQVISLRAAGQHRFLQVTVEGDLKTTGAGGTVQNRGSILAAFDNYVVTEDGTDRRGPMSLTAERMLCEAQAASALTTVRAVVPGAGNTTQHLKETFRIYFAKPRQIRRRETAYVVMNPQKSFNLEFILNNVNNGVLRVLTGGTGATLENVKLTVVQKFDLAETSKPFFQPTASLVTQKDIVAANGDHQIELKLKNNVRTLIIQSLAGANADQEVSDIITSLALGGDNGWIIGPEKVDVANLVADEENEYGGAVISNGAYIIIDFCDEGRLSSMLNKTQDTNFVLALNDAASATGGVSRIKVWADELEHDINRVGLDGRPIVDEPPYPY
jgi:hypothetical protein